MLYFRTILFITALPCPQAPVPSPRQALRPSSLLSVSSGILEEASPRSAEMPDCGQLGSLKKASTLMSNIHQDLCFLYMVCSRAKGSGEGEQRKRTGMGTSLVVQWLRIRLPVQGTWVRALVQEDPMCRGATKPVRHNYRACALGPESHNY